jgi:putative transposase
MPMRAKASTGKIRQTYEFIKAHRNRFNVRTMCQAWVTDITYIRTWEGWLYLAVVMDLFSRKIVGWSTRPTIASELVLDTVLMAVRRRQPRRTVIHSDQGSQYGSDDWRRVLQN